MEDIILSIERTIISNDFNLKPIMIYIGVGTFAGMLTNHNNNMILEDKNYHQFPPTIQKIFNENKDLHLFIILIDPVQEDPLYMVNDSELNKKYFNNEWIHINSEQLEPEIYINNRISIYPFRKSIQIKINNHTNSNYIDITNNLSYLNKFCMDNDITLIYHDFTGHDTHILLRNYFNKDIQNNLDHICYGIGEIDGCYYDLTSDASYFATTVEFSSRKIIKIFNLIKILNEYNQNKYKFSLKEYINFQIEKYSNEDIKYIQMQISNFKNNFKTKFKNNIIYLLRIIKDLNQDTNLLDLQYYLNKIDLDNKINKLIHSKDKDIFQKTIEILANNFNNEILICTLDTKFNEFNSIQIIEMITAHSDKYKWHDTFNQIFL
jgi:hypothetical protein